MALSLTVREGEVFKIGDALVMFKHYTSNQYRLIIKAPKEVRVLRPDLVPEDEKIEFLTGKKAEKKEQR